MLPNPVPLIGTVVPTLPLVVPIAVLGRDGLMRNQADALLKQGIGHIAGPGLIGHKRPETLAKSVNAIQRYLVTETRLKIPAIFHNEALNGVVAPSFTAFPTPIGLAATWVVFACYRPSGTVDLWWTLRVGDHIRAHGEVPRTTRWTMDAVRDLPYIAHGWIAAVVFSAVKDRFGPTDEIGVFEMRFEGLTEVDNPSALFLNDADRGSPGTAVFAGMEGTRPILVEIQGLVAPSSLGTPRRAVVGWDPNRLSMLLAVLEARCGVRLGGHDVYLNVAGGLRLTKPAADLAAAAALLSSFTGHAVPEDTAYFGEVSLTGSVRAVGHTDQRLKETAKLGFARAVIPAASVSSDREIEGIALSPVSQLDELVAWFALTSD